MSNIETKGILKASNVLLGDIDLVNKLNELSTSSGVEGLNNVINNTTLISGPNGSFFAGEGAGIVEGKPSGGVNVAIGKNSKTCLGGVAIGNEATTLGGSVAIGGRANADSTSLAMCNLANATGIGAIALGAASKSYNRGISIGYYAQAGVDPTDENKLLSNIQIGKGTNNKASTLQICDDNIYDYENHKLTVQNIELDGTNVNNKFYSDSKLPYNVAVKDIRDYTSAGDRTPFQSRTVTPFFTDKNMPTSDWWSGIDVSGWIQESYKNWQLVSQSDNGENVENPSLFIREINYGAVGSWKQIVTTGTSGYSGQLTLGREGYKTYNGHGYSVNEYGNFKHLRDTNTDSFHIDGYDGSENFVVNFETGETKIKNKVVVAVDSFGDNWVRYTDGIQKCWGTLTWNRTNSTGSDSRTINFGQPFRDTKYALSLTIKDTTTSNAHISTPYYIDHVTTTSQVVYIQNVNNASYNAGIDWMAEGRWK